ncbi:MAG: hypothetical protein ACI8RZ_004179 [Myxococcota bacterium]|jgi:hypothetical protein
MLPLLIIACDGDSGHTSEAGDYAASDHGHDSETPDYAASDHAHDVVEGYTDEDAVAAVQNPDPWTDPDHANLKNLWHDDERGYMWLDQARWSMDNRTDPAAIGDRHELIQMFHESLECDDTMAFADCNSTTALKIYANGPRITDNDWSKAGHAAAAVRRYHTHASGIYLVSYGQNFTPTDYGYGVIAPSGLHLEPHGAHQAIRIDGTANAGENMRIDVMAGGTGQAIYGSTTPAYYCDELGFECDETRLQTLRGGIVRLEDVTIERTAIDARNSGVVTVSDSSLGVESFYSWHTDADSSLPVHCAWNDTVTFDSLIKVTAYSTSPDLLVAHSYAIVAVWGPGGAPTACTDTQNIKTNASGVYGYDFGTSVEAGGGYAIAILGPDPDPLYPGDWDEGDRPAFLYEVLEPI